MSLFGIEWGEGQLELEYFDIYCRSIKGGYIAVSDPVWGRQFGLLTVSNYPLARPLCHTKRWVPKLGWDCDEIYLHGRLNCISLVKLTWKELWTCCREWMRCRQFACLGEIECNKVWTMLTMEYQIRNSLNSVDSFKKYSRVFFLVSFFFVCRLFLLAK